MGDTQRSDREKQSKWDTFLVETNMVWSSKHFYPFLSGTFHSFILAIPPPNLEEMQRKTNFHFQLKMLILLAISLLPFKMCQIQQQFRNESSPSLPIPLKLGNSPSSTIRLKRQYPFPSGQSACSGCPSKFTPVNCKCTSTQNDELICRCDRAILSNLREEPDRPQCPCRRGINAAGDLNNFRGEITELTSRIQNLGGINSACHPICHQSCLNSCTRPIGREIDSYRDRQDRYGPMATNTNDVPNHQQSSPSSSSVQHQYPLEQVPGCQPSLCRTNCLRACSRILDGQKGGGSDFGDPRGPSTDPYQENLGGGIEPPTHYEVRPVDLYLGKMPSPEYPQLMGKNEGPTSSGGNCQCSPGAFCDCPETCFPICFDSCDANCNSNNQAQGQTQRRICAQSCHYECQRNCAEKQRQKQQQLGGNELGMNNNNNPTNNVAGGWTPSPPQIADNNDSDGEFQQGNNGIGNNQQAVMPTNCLAKCPKSCETACSMTNEDPANCVPACVSICAQSCARGLNQFDANSGQTPQIPNIQIQRQQQQFQQNIEGNLQQQQAQLRQQLMEGLERSKMQSMPTMQMPIMNGGGIMPFPFEMNSFKNGSGKEGINNVGQQSQQMSQTSQLPPTMFLNDGLGNNAARGMTFSQPCAPLCQPACTPECNRRYMEERRGQQRLYRGIGSQFGNVNSNPQQQINRINGVNEQTFNGQLNNFGGNQIPGQGTGQFESKPVHIFPPHYILPLADDLDLANGTVDDFLVEGAKQMDDDLELEALLRPQNETGLTKGITFQLNRQFRNSTQIVGKKEGTKIREEKPRTVKPETTLTSAKPWKGGKVAKNGGMKMEEFFKRRMGKLMKLGDKKAIMKGEQIAMGNEQQSNNNNNNNKWPLGEEGGKGKMAPKLNYS